MNERIISPERMKHKTTLPKVITKEEIITWRKNGYCISFQITYRRNKREQLFYCTLKKRGKSRYVGWISRNLMLEFVSESKIREVETTNRITIGVSRIIDKLLEKE